MTDSRIDVDLTALHEAGHAVLQCRLLPELYIGDVTIVADALNLGVCYGEDLGVDEDAEMVRKHVIVLCAGYAAELVSGAEEGSARIGARFDLSAAQEYCDRWRLGLVDEFIKSAMAEVSDSDNRNAIMRVAAELQLRRTLSGDVIELLIQVADGEISEEEYAAYLKLRDSHNAR